VKSVKTDRANQIAIVFLDLFDCDRTSEPSSPRDENRRREPKKPPYLVSIDKALLTIPMILQFRAECFSDQEPSPDG
jgi:hypothetical protein